MRLCKVLGLARPGDEEVRMETPRMMLMTLLTMVVTVLPISASAYFDASDAVDYFVDYLLYLWW